MSYPTNDEQFSDVTVTEVGDGHFTSDDGWSLCFPSDSPAQPKVGGMVRTYGRGLGYPVRGLFFDGEEVYYRTAEEDKQHQEVGVYGRDAADLLARWDAGRAVHTVEVGGLGPGYEQAIHIAMFEVLRHMLQADYDTASWSEDGGSWKDDLPRIEDAVLPSISCLGLSGAQWGAAVTLAARFCLRRPAEVVQSAPEDRHIQVSRHFPSPPSPETSE